MKNIVYIAFVVASAIYLESCSWKERSFATTKEMNEYVNDNGNGFIQTSAANDHIISAKINPVMKGDDAFTVQMRISREDGQAVLMHHQLSPSQVAEKELYLSFDVLQDVYVICDEKEIHPILHHYEHNYKLKPSLDVSFSFPMITPSSEVKFIFRDNVFNSGLHELIFEKEVFEPFTIKQ